MFNITKIKEIFEDFLYTTVGSVLISVGTSLFLLPYKISTGGFSGIATVFYYLYGIRIGSLILVLNVPLFIVGFFLIGKYFFIKTVYSTWLLSYVLNFIAELKVVVNVDDKMVAVIFGGIIVGIGTSLVFLGNSSTGGSELLIQIIQHFSKKIKISHLIIAIDSIVVIFNMLVFKNIEIGLYSLIAIYLNSKMVDTISEGINFSKVVYIISDKPNEISKSILNTLNKGVTGLYGRGMYRNEEMLILVCVVKNRDLLGMKKLVYSIDKNAFMFITDSAYVYGLGFSKEV